ncbi:MAG: hypothetical protein Q8P10_02375 [bacterium]|nr:hypothetical protein [bacterium]
MDNYSLPFIEYPSGNASASPTEGVFVSYKTAYKAYIAPKTRKIYGLSGNAYEAKNIKVIDIENENNYRASYIKSTYVPDAKDLLYERYAFMGQTNNLWQKFSNKLVSLKETIGEQLFDRLSFDQQLVMATTIGVINADFINPRSISRDIRG